MTYFFKNGNTINVTDSRAMSVYEHLPGGNYVVKVDPFGAFFLEGVDPFTLPKKVYGSNDDRRNRIIRTFLERPRSTGVLLSGEKGSGKTLLTKSLAIELARQDIPTLIINTPFQGDGFNKFIQTIQQPCVILFDEFEKVYDEDDQEKLLTLLDGVFPSKKLFLLTMNTGYIDPHLRNRPGRIFYQYTYRGLTADFIREYCEDNLDDKSQTEKLVTIADCFSNFNFDMLSAVVEEMNRYKETAADAMQNVNARLEFNMGSGYYDMEVFVNGTEVSPGNYSPRKMQTNPMVMEHKPDMSFYGVPNGKKDAEGDDEYFQMEDFALTDDKIVKVEKGGTIVYEHVTSIEKNRVLVRVIKPQQGSLGFNFNAF